MSSELHEIPPAWRHVRWTSVVWCRWPIGLIGLGLAVYGGLVALMLFHAQSSRAADDARLDAARVIGEATVTGLEERRDGRVLVRYEFGVEGGRAHGSVLAVPGRFDLRDRVQVEYDAAQPSLNRIAGQRLDALGDLSTPVLGLAVFPGLLLLLLWLQSVIDLKLLLARGDTARAEILDVRPVRMVIPLVVRVEYRFRDYRARWCRGAHWVRVHSPLGERLCAGDRWAVVVSDRRHPWRNRLASAADFVLGGETAAVPSRARSA